VIWRDLRYAIRTLIRSPGFFAVAFVAIALGIGVNTTILGIVNTLLLRPLPIGHADRVVQVFTTDTHFVGRSANSYLNFLDYQKQNSVFSGMAAYSFAGVGMTRGGETSNVLGQLVSGNYFDMLGVQPFRGRLLHPSDDVKRGGHPVAMFSLEMSKESLLQRLVASVAQIDAHKFRTGHLSKEDWRRMTESLGTISSAPLWIDDAGSISVLEIGAKARRLKRDKGLSMLVVDYLQLITARGRFGNRQEEVSSISRGLKGLAKELQIPVLVLSQLTRAPERDERGPQLSDLRESGAIEQDADMVMFIYRPHFFKAGATPEEREETELRIAKQRNGPTDLVKFVFRSRFTRFEEAAPDAFSQYAPDDL